LTDDIFIIKVKLIMIGVRDLIIISRCGGAIVFRKKVIMSDFE